ncbi:MAG: type II toxin-antitoxin system RelE/ParE family toxin [Bacteroidales bacterium]|nr:type II toxin-antitoxin system RelE/ParE family toxin [Bacteroidales bacterium]
MFENEALEDLYFDGQTNDKRYNRLPLDIVRRFKKAVDYIIAAPRVEDLFRMKSLHYEKKQGNLKGVSAVWINDQYRLLFYTSPNEQGIIINAIITELSKHYE